MKKRFPKISVIITARPKDRIDRTVEAVYAADYPKRLIEIIVSKGRLPSSQRNEAAKKASGGILYFLDNDSEVGKKTFKKIVEVFSGRIRRVVEPKGRGFSVFPKWISDLIIERFFSGKIYKGEIGVVGGPNVWTKGESFWSSMASTVLESFFVHFQMAARYRPIGGIHRASEKELILCNLAIRKNVFKKAGGFNKTLYPNEENELLNRIEKLGYQLVYYPQALVYRPRRQSLKTLLAAFFNYGRGRMEQIRVEGIFRSLIQIMPLPLLFYCLLLSFYHPLPLFLPLTVYFVAGLFSALGVAVRKRKKYLLGFLPILFFLVHITYALGLIYGMNTNLNKKQKNKRRKIKTIKVVKAWF